MKEYTEAVALADRSALRIERGWCQGAAATTRDGVKVNEASPVAVNYCLLGAVYAEGLSEHAEILEKELTQALDEEYLVGLISWNDSPERTKQEVIEALQQAKQQLLNKTQEGTDAGQV